MATVKPPNPKALKNYAILKVYATVLCLIILFFVVLRLADHIIKKSNSRHHNVWKRVPGLRILDKLYRSTHRFAGQRVPGFPSLGHALLSSFYIVVNVILVLINQPGYELKNIASRLGFITASNMALATFFGLKNTPLAILSADTYNRLNFFHRVVGYTTVVEVAFHACFYAGFATQTDRLHLFTEENQVRGITAGLSLVALSLAYFRQHNYELFYISHVVFFMLCVISVGLHRPKWELKLPIIALFSGCLWGFDRTLRASRLLFNMINNKATLHPLPLGGVRVHLKKPLAGAVPGSHCFLWIPHIRAFQTHPFTIVSNSSLGMELVMGCYNGFTKATFDLATKEPGMTVFGAVEGPYGSLSQLQDFNRFILIAGGSGASFTFGLANKLLSQFEFDSERTMDFIWTVREEEKLDWYAEHLRRLKSSNVDVSLYVTQGSSTESSADQTSKVLESNKTAINGNDRITMGVTHSPTALDEKVSTNSPRSNSPSGSSTNLDHAIKNGRLDVESILTNTLHASKENDQVLVAVCGPISLAHAVEESVRSQITSSGPRIEVHSETFDF